MTHELVVIGGGNMGAALLAGLTSSGAFDVSSVAVVEPSSTRRDELAERFPGVTVSATSVACEAAVLAVKPPDVPAVAVAAVEAGARRLLSIAAGVDTSTIEAAIDGGVSGATGRVAVVRSMPNTPSIVGLGVAAICAGAAATDADLDWAERILGAVGMCVRLDEEHFDAVTGLTGSGPAYVFAVAEALIAAGLAAGLPAGVVEPMVTQLLLGSATLLARNGDPADLRARVTSPGGTTAAGLAVLDARELSATIAAAVDAAAARSRELGGR
jgi:pyrroline-5-carboxylate reductase